LIDGRENGQPILLRSREPDTGSTFVSGSQEGNLLLKVIRHVLRSVVVSDGKTLGDALSEAAEVLAPRLADRFQRLEAGGACMGVDADAFS
jgi:hypothetical protein